MPKPGSDDVLWLIDLSNYVFRAYHALPPLMNSNGESTGATLGTLNMLNRMIEDNRPRYLGVVTDSKNRGFRREIDPQYKANRSAAPPELVQQINRTKEIFEGYRVPIFHQDGYEADDLIATLTKLAVKQGLRVVVASTDKDLMQLVVPGKVVCWDAMRNNVYGIPEVEKKFGVTPDRVRHVLALIGDSSDNVPGVPGVGPKTAAKLINKFGTIDGVYEHIDDIPQPKLNANLREHEAAVRRAFELVQLRDDAEVTLDLATLTYGNPNKPVLRKLFTELQFTRFLELIGEEDSEPPPDSMPTPTYRTILAPKQLRTMCEEAQKSGVLSIAVLTPSADAMSTPLTGIALSPRQGSAAYVPLEHRYLTAPRQLPLDEVREHLAPVLADRAIQKVGHDLKFTAVVLSRFGLDIVGAKTDSMLASYLLDPEATTKLSRLSGDFAQRIAAFEEEIYALAGREFTIGSPKQLGEVLFDEMGLPGGKKGKTGAYATGAGVLDQLVAQGHELPARVLDWRQLSKLKSTYTDALVEQINPDTGRVHTSFHMAGAATGRLASSDPNLQNIPVRTEEGRKIRRAFVAAEGCRLLSLDYSQIELRLLAHVAEIEALKDAFHHGADIHAMTASQVFGVPMEGMDPMTRRKAKAINFGIIYGISAFRARQSAGHDQDRGAAVYRGLFRALSRHPRLYGTSAQNRRARTVS